MYRQWQTMARVQDPSRSYALQFPFSKLCHPASGRTCPSVSGRGFMRQCLKKWLGNSFSRTLIFCQLGSQCLTSEDIEWPGFLNRNMPGSRHGPSRGIQSARAGVPDSKWHSLAPQSFKLSWHNSFAC